MDLTRERRVEIYNRFVQLALGEGLLPSHLEELEQRRGLTEETVVAARLFSADPARIPVCIQSLRGAFSDAELCQAGLLLLEPPCNRNRGNEHYKINAVLVDGGIIIPYIGADGQVIYLRAHKWGPAGVDLEVYGQHIFQKLRPSRIVLTEGEFKALALQQSGIPALAIPGISSFGGKHFKKLVRVLEAHHISEVVILFDNEIKDDPSLPGFKEDSLRRWDTDYWACKMARRLYGNDAPEVKLSLVARLPDEWRIDGKIDPDAALAAGHTPAELHKVIDEAVIADRYVELLPLEGRIVVGYRKAKDDLDRKKQPLREEKGIYRWRQGEAYQDLSNFVLLPGRRVRRAGGTLERIFVARNVHGEEAEVILKPEDLVAVASFKKKLLNAGNFRWSGNQAHLDHLQERCFVLASPRIAEETDRFGRMEDDAWAFGDGIIGPTGQVHPMSEDGVVWGTSLFGAIPLEDQKCPKPMLVGIDGPVPPLVEIHNALVKNLGTPAIGLGLGWTLACVWSDEIFGELRSFPILGVFGKYQAGKTTIGRWLTGAWGLPDHGQNPIKISGSTAKGIDRSLAKYSSMPVWCDEYRNDLKDYIKHSLRSVFDRSSSVQAQFTSGTETTGTQIRGCLLLSGEEAPTDPALLSRIVQIRASEGKRSSDAEDFKAAQIAAARLPLIVRDCIKYRAARQTHVLACIHKMHERLGPSLRDERLAWLYSVPLGAFASLLSSHADEASGLALSQMVTWVVDELAYVQLQKREEDHITRFWKGVGILTRRFGTNRLSLINRAHINVSNDGKTFYFRLEDTYQTYSEMMQRGQGPAPLSEAALRAYLNESPFVKKSSKGSLKTTPRKCRDATGALHSKRFLMLDLEHNDTPWPVQELAQRIMDNRQYWDHQDYADEAPTEDVQLQEAFIQ